MTRRSTGLCGPHYVCHSASCEVCRRPSADTHAGLLRLALQRPPSARIKGPAGRLRSWLQWLRPQQRRLAVPARELRDYIRQCAPSSCHQDRPTCLLVRALLRCCSVHYAPRTWVARVSDVLAPGRINLCGCRQGLRRSTVSAGRNRAEDRQPSPDRPLLAVTSAPARAYDLGRGRARVARGPTTTCGPAGRAAAARRVGKQDPRC